MALAGCVLTTLSACGSPRAATGAAPNPPVASSPSANATYPNGISPSWLSEAMRVWGSAPSHPLVLSPMMTRVSYDNVAQPATTLAVLDAELSMLEQTGAQGITVDLGYDAWLSDDTETIAKDDAVVAAIRDSGRLVVLKDASAERYRHRRLPWDQFAAAWIDRARTMAARYHPDFYTVIKEPPWYAPMIAGLSRTDASSAADRQVLAVTTWTSLLARLVSAVKSVSPTTKVGIAVDGNVYGSTPADRLDLGLMQAAVSMPGLDFIGFDLYTANAFSDTQRFLAQVGRGDKAVWINEAWSTTATQAANPAQEQVDPSWAKVLLAFARTIGAQGVSPFFTDRFASYEAPPADAAGLSAFYRGRTPVFGAFRGYEAACRAGAPAESVSTPC